jgi:serine/threonine protein kinase
MEFLHEKAGVVHRDLKPENVLFKSEATRGGRRDILKARPLCTLVIAGFLFSTSYRPRHPEGAPMRHAPSTAHPWYCSDTMFSAQLLVD